MRKLLAIIFLLCTTCLADPIERIQSPLHNNTWFADTAKIMKADSVRVLDLEIDALEQANGTQLTVVTVANTAGMTPKDFATRLFNHWGVGQEGVNNGVMILVVTEARRIEFEVGDGANRYLTNSDCQNILQSRVIPKFKAGDYNGGVVQAVRGVIADLKDVDYSAVESPPPGPQSQRAVSADTKPESFYDYEYEGDGSFLGWLFGGLGVVVVGGIAGIRRHFRNKPRVCPSCRAQMVRLDEVADDEYLDAGQRMEEALGSIDYDVWVCHVCDEQEIVSYGKWFSSFSKCGSCGYKALETSNTTVTAATTYSEGQGRCDETCRHCDYSNTSYYSIARIQESDSSSSSSSWSSSSDSGFGGGSSSGGGSGASW